ncbi:iron-containing alcohol dehydrogenase [Schinkia azotoformans]|uniref:1-propanol dehydrogenase PduQ n=1 Tax=Schinkia azotoformans TaxID=1454 RepID=UPI002E1FA9EE|nr:iron-containing alcohol dehydrogenase [Schinkia azotoformans]
MEEISFRTKIYTGENALDRLKTISSEKIMIISDPYIVKSGIIQEVVSRLESNGNAYIIFDNIIPDPPLETVAAGVKELLHFSPSIIIAIGGGSAIDAAKAIKDFSEKLQPKEAKMTFIAVPTTSGTGSEVTSFSVITDKDKGVKYPLVADSLLPDEAILDTALVMTVPSTITADTGMDVLTHALEAYVSIKANSFSDAFAEKAIQLVFEYLPRAYENGNDLEAREKIHQASCLAGLAFNMVGLGINHSIAHVCGAQFKIAHGRMNAILLPTVIEYNADLPGYDNRNASFTAAAKKYAHAAKIIDSPIPSTRSGVKSLLARISKLKKTLNIPESLTECGVTKEQLKEAQEKIITTALNDACTVTNPRTPSRSDIETIIDKIQ